MKKINNHKTAITATFLVAVSCFLVGCATSQHTTGRPIDERTVALIVHGQTNADDILAWFGAPTSTSSLGENQLYIYKYCVSKGSAFSTGYFGKTQSEEKCDELTVTFNKEGKVKAHNFVKRVEQ